MGTHFPIVQGGPTIHRWLTVEQMRDRLCLWKGRPVGLQDSPRYAIPTPSSEKERSQAMRSKDLP